MKKYELEMFLQYLKAIYIILIG